MLQYISHRSQSSGLIICIILCALLKSISIIMIGFIGYTNIADWVLDQPIDTSCNIRPRFVGPKSRGVNKSNVVELTTSEIQTRITDRPDAINHTPVKEKANRLGLSRNISNLICIPRPYQTDYSRCRHKSTVFNGNMAKA